MRILLTNDDGIHAEGLAVLAIVAWLLYRTAMKPQPVVGEVEGGPH